MAQQTNRRNDTKQKQSMRICIYNILLLLQETESVKKIYYYYVQNKKILFFLVNIFSLFGPPFPFTFILLPNFTDEK